MMDKIAVVGIIIFIVIASSGCLYIPGTRNSISPSPQTLSESQILGTWHGSNNLTYTFGNTPKESGANGNVTVVDDTTIDDTAYGYYNNSSALGSWYAKDGYYVVNMYAATFNSGMNSTWADNEGNKLAFNINSIFMGNDSGRLYFYDFRAPSMRYYKVS